MLKSYRKLSYRLSTASVLLNCKTASPASAECTSLMNNNLNLMKKRVKIWPPLACVVFFVLPQNSLNAQIHICIHHHTYLKLLSLTSANKKTRFLFTSSRFILFLKTIGDVRGALMDKHLLD